MTGTARRALPLSAAFLALFALLVTAGAPAGAVPAAPAARAAQGAGEGITTRRMAAALPTGGSASVEVRATVAGLSWVGDAGARLSIDAREGSTWSRRGEVEAFDRFGPDPGSPERRADGRYDTEPVYLGDASAVRVRVEAGSVRDLRLHAVRAESREATVAPSGGGWLSTQPAIFSRAQWGADEGLRLANCPGGPTYNNRLRLGVVHHTAGSNSYGADDVPGILRGIYIYETQQLGYCDFAYNFAVDKWGRVWEGRFGGLAAAVQGAHASGFNRETVGAAFIGDYSRKALEPAAAQAMAGLLAWKLGIWGVDPLSGALYVSNGNDRFPAGTPVGVNTVVGHGETNPTSCPGAGVFEQLGAIRFMAGLAAWFAPPPTFPGWQPQAGRPKVMAVSVFGGLYPGGGEPALAPGGFFAGRDMARDIELLPSGGGYVLDAWGGIHPFGGAPPLWGAAYWPGFDIARDIALLPGGQGGYVLDGWGGIHPIGNAPPLVGTGYWPGFDVARAIALRPAGGAYVLDAWGGIHEAGGAPVIPTGPYWPWQDVARDIEIRPAGGAYVLDNFGGVYPVGGAPPIAHRYFGEDLAVDFELLPSGTGGYTLDRQGLVFPAGNAPAVAVGTPSGGLRKTIALGAV